ncbi:MAG TPA: beta-N-acetylhexosaminidase [Gemmatimonadaceae bacterium]|nr:beta-N-acetylhexosaminidase [Gemmatimonadaceae bacterium]
MITRFRSTAFLQAGVALSCALAACRPATPVTTTASPSPTPPAAAAPAAAAAAEARPAALTPLASLSAHRLVPQPLTVNPGSGAPFTITATTSIVVPAGNAELARTGEQLAHLLRVPTASPIPVTPSNAAAPRGAIVLRVGGPASLGEEGYELAISADSVRITAAQPAGVFRGVQTLRQLLPAGIEMELTYGRRAASAWSVPAGTITDRPRFMWRGAMLDVARHFFTVKEVKQFIDVLALYKLNIFHIHLADDQGWRIQIDSRPKLTEIGGATQVGGGPGGFYTKAEYADIVRYASERYITVVPEIDMPGHTNAAIAAYPELSCSRPMPPSAAVAPVRGTYTGTEVGWTTFCPDSENAYAFVEDVVREIAAMTPGPYFHMGGDEVHLLKDPQYIKFVERVQDIVYKHGKTMVGWEEIGKARLRPTSIAQQWKSDTVPPAVRQGAKVVMSPAPKAYLDMKYDRNTELGLTWAALIELRTAYEWEPATYMKGVPEQQILGVEGALWSETIHNIGSAMFLTLPRLPALAELGWTSASHRSWENFRQRIAAHAPRWRLLGMNYYPSPQVDWNAPAASPPGLVP